MAKNNSTKLYDKLQKDYPDFLAAWEGVTAATRGRDVLDDRTAHLVRLAAAAAVRSEGAVHSHVRRALEAGVAPREIEQAILLTTTSIGFPAAVAAMSWAHDIIGEAGKKAAKKRKR